MCIISKDRYSSQRAKIDPTGNELACGKNLHVVPKSLRCHRRNSNPGEAISYNKTTVFSRLLLKQNMTLAQLTTNGGLMERLCGGKCSSKELKY